MSALVEIVRFQTDRGLDKKEYDALNEHTNIVEELLESIGLDVSKENREILKDRWHNFVNELVIEEIATETLPRGVVVPVDVSVDAHCDAVVFHIGALLKLGHCPEKSLLETAKEINSRVGTMVGGKFEKDLSDEAQANWYKADYSNCKIEVS